MQKVNTTKVLDAVTLAATYAATQAVADRVEVDTSEADKINLYVSYTTGAGETLNQCDLMIEGFDGTNWIQIGESSITAGAATHVAITFEVPGAAAATEYTAHFIIDSIFEKVRVAALESGVASNFGTVTASVIVK